ncbi:MAG TPA: class IV adenylate cyclase [Verrucomicrobiae bacterium]|nr:class IV adenylate cyclase [Verrucomicrobiae bacterium]
MTGLIETEVKIPVPNSAAILEQFDRVGLALSAPRQFESNTLYDSGDGRLRQAGMILRLRESGGKFVVTWKGPEEPGKHKIRPELETTVGSLDVMREILRHLGFEPVFRYEKYRREFTGGKSPSGVVTLDETPIGNFLELEGPADWIDEMARLLRFSPNDYLLESYGRLYRKYCERQGVEPRDMVFTS